MNKMSKGERKNNNKLLKTMFEKCAADMLDLTNYFLAYNKLISSVMEILISILKMTPVHGKKL